MPRRRTKKRQDTLSLIVGGLMIAVVLTIVVVLMWLKPEAVKIDSETLCRSEGPSSITAVLIDQTDSFGPITKSDLEVQIRDLFGTIKENHEVSIFTVESTLEKVLDPIIQVCNPGDPDKADPLIRSKEIIRRKLQEKFWQPLEEVLRNLLEKKEAPLSPIMESVQSVSITHFQSTKRRSVPRRLIIISDLLQNSDAVSFYRDNPDYERFKKTLEFRGLNPDLRDVDVEIWLIQRKQPQQGDGGALLKFFRSWLSEHGGHVVRVLRTSGINN